jgi:hypothetical protein
MFHYFAFRKPNECARTVRAAVRHQRAFQDKDGVRAWMSVTGVHDAAGIAHKLKEYTCLCVRVQNFAKDGGR